MLYKKYLTFCKKRYKDPKNVNNIHEFFVGEAERKGISLKTLYRNIEKNYPKNKEFGRLLAKEVISNFDDFPFFEYLDLAEEDTFSLYERRLEAIRILKKLQILTPELRSKPLSNPNFLLLIGIANELAICEDYENVHKIFKFVFSYKLNMPMMYYFMKVYVNLISDNFDGIFIQMNNPIFDDFLLLRNILYFLYYSRNARIPQAREYLYYIKEECPALFNLFAFRHFNTDEPLYRYGLDVEIAREIPFILDKLNNAILKDPDLISTYHEQLCIYLTVFIEGCCTSYLYSDISREKINISYRAETIERAGLDYIGELIVVSIDEFYKIRLSNHNDSLLINYKSLVSFLQGQNVLAFEDYLHTDTSDSIPKLTIPMLDERLDKLASLNLIRYKAEGKRDFIILDDLFILSDYYYQEIYMRTFNLKSPFDDCNYRGDN